MAIKSPHSIIKEIGLKNRELELKNKELELKNCELAKAIMESIVAKDMSMRGFPSLAATPSLAGDETLDAMHAPPPASEAMIDKTIGEVYDEADEAGMKPPNIKEIVEPVQRLLRTKGCEASGRRIQQIAGRHINRRRKPGPTLASEKRRQRQ